MTSTTTAPRKLRNDFLFLTDEDARRYPGKRGKKKRLNEIKASIKARRSMTPDEYKALLTDRGRRLKVIQILYPILSDQEALQDFGFDEEDMSMSFDDLLTDDTMEGQIRDALEAHSIFTQAVYDHGLTREEYRKELNRVKLFGSSLVEKGELAIDFVIWRMYAFIGFLAVYRLGMSEEEARALSANPSLAREIEYAVKKRLITRYSCDINLPYAWRVHRPDADRMKAAFPGVAGLIEQGVFF